MKYRKQNGMTLIGFVIVLALTVFFAYVAMRIVPLYLEYHALTSAMEQLENDPAAASQSPAAIKTRLINSLWVNYATDNIRREHMRITKSDGVKLRVAYEVRRPLVGNVDLILSFDKTVTLR
jgi:membrane protein implicated in regulation of membrane protease activity